MNIRFLLVTILLAAIPTQPLVAQGNTGKPAVQGLEVNFEPENGEVEGNAYQGMQGSVVFPVSHRWGGQLDLMSGDIDHPQQDYDIFGGTAHLFWRDPARAMIDFSVSSVDTDLIDFNRLDVLIDYYWGQRTVTVGTGYQFGDIPHSITGVFQFRDYINDVLTVHLDAAAADSQTIYGGGFDFRTPFQGLHLFGQALAGNNNFDAYIVGIRLYFGARAPSNSGRDKSLSLAPGISNIFFLNFDEINRAQSVVMTGMMDPQGPPPNPQDNPDNPPPG